MKISKGTIIRTAVLILALVNNGLVIAGKSPLPITDEALTQGLSYAITTVAALIAWWKNNSFTKEAIRADEYLEELRNE